MADQSVKKMEETNEEKFERLQREAEELVTVQLFKDGGKYKDDVIVGLNGTIWQIQRGKEVEVPRKIAEILKESEIQKGIAIDYMEGLQKESSI